MGPGGAPHGGSGEVQMGVQEPDDENNDPLCLAQSCSHFHGPPASAGYKT